ncbi:MAG TPA: hypothetical protein VG318_05880 [Actinomycetota bacterium]|nr:hypothetical protein [Actinomycetota bacterium]
MSISVAAALQRVLVEGDEWQSWRALRLSREAPADLPAIPYQDDEGAFIGPGGRASPGATGEGLCHLVLLGLGGSGAAAIAADWLEDARTPALAWLDPPEEVPGELDVPGASRVWATASATCGLLATGRDPGHRALSLLRGEADSAGRFTGGGYPTFAAAGAFWLAEGPKTEMAEWGLKWAREAGDEWWGAWERATALTFWAAAAIPIENATVETFLDELTDAAPAEGWPDDLGLTLRTLELIDAFGG